MTETSTRGSAAVARRTHNPEVAGSNPASATLFECLNASTHRRAGSHARRGSSSSPVPRRAPSSFRSPCACNAPLPKLFAMKNCAKNSADNVKLPEFLDRRVVASDRGHATPCLEWTAALHLGYGWVSHNGKPQLAHRLAYQAIRGPIPKGLVIDHLCCNRKCLNPDHLEAVTLAVNTRRAHPNYFTDDMTVCPKGHALTPGYVIPTSKGSRRCLRCERGENARPYRGPIKDRTHCPQGHPYSGENLYLTPKGSKVCRICRAASHRKAAK